MFHSQTLQDAQPTETSAVGTLPPNSLSPTFQLVVLLPPWRVDTRHAMAQFQYLHRPRCTTCVCIQQPAKHSALCSTNLCFQFLCERPRRAAIQRSSFNHAVEKLQTVIQRVPPVGQLVFQRHESPPCASHPMFYFKSRAVRECDHASQVFYGFIGR